MKQVPFKRSLFIALFLACGLSHAADPKMIGEFNDWTAYVYMEGKNKVCYMVSKPKKEEGSYTKRGSVYALLTHRPAENSKNVFSFMAGYPFKKESEVTVSIGNQNFKLFTDNETAWAQDSDTDNKIANAIRNGSALIIKGVSARDTATTDTFGLKGSSSAYGAISKECGIK
ncbi:MAG TPA: invasion associated locus B family protein [Nitrosomonas sp.]|nr:invasion associated locus B family protein [Nitrosomonas sp.]HMW68931.1 invasion associated locus B family protein [Nitrosomonas sp.]HMY60798.1 invasion associated locus B family protein [Nitrosomonas sp.]HMY89265.1 invasion associated locus B family protein [Nitrosomonas sp.]HNA70545.1 invasion associated locus B family protein [Nitrosomonas sp.]